MPQDRGIIDQQLQSLGDSSRWWEMRELRDLPVVLDAGERILAISRGKVARVRVMRRPWLIVVTDRRLLCLRSSRGQGWRQFDVGADLIARVALRIGLFRGRVLVVAEDRKYRLLVPRLDAYKLMSALTSLGAPTDVMTFGPTRVVRQVLDHVLALPAAAFDPQIPRALPVGRVPDPSDQRIQLLENEVNELRQQIDFLEELLRERHAGANTTSTTSIE